MYWAPYVPVAKRQAQARKEMERRRKKGLDVQPIVLTGRTIASSFWGKAWCDHFDSLADFRNRLPRGQRYVRNGSVCHLGISPGRVDAFVSGSELYNIRLKIRPLKADKWLAIKQRCAGRIGSMLELLQGRFSDEVMGIVTDKHDGLFPLPREIQMSCDCPDWARLCKHLAAVLYGIGARLDTQPELLFHLRGVDSQELLAVDASLPVPAAAGKTLAANALADVFGIELAEPAPPAQPPAPSQPARKTRRKSTAAGSARSKSNGQSVTGKKIAALRRKKSLSVAEFAEALTVSEASIRRWESIRKPLKLHARTLAALEGLGLHK